MAEPEDVVVPILRSIQGNLARLDGKVDELGARVEQLDGKVERLGAKVDSHGVVLLNAVEKLDAIERLMTWHLGLTTEHKHMIEVLQDQMKDLQQRVTVLEERD